MDVKTTSCAHWVVGIPRRIPKFEEKKEKMDYQGEGGGEGCHCWISRGLTYKKIYILNMRGAIFFWKNPINAYYS